MKKSIRCLYVILSIFLIVGLFIVLLLEKANSRRLERIKNNLESNNSILATWLCEYIKNEDAFKYFRRNQIGSVAIYGLGTIGTLLFDSLSRCPEIDLKYIIDKNMYGRYKGMEIIPIEKIKQQEQVDAIIVTPHFAFSSIEKDLKPYTDAKIISFLEILVS